MSNSAKTNTYPIVVIGAGAGGLVIAIGATKAGKKVLLIEEGFYGGDCTNFGCIPSKSLIASAHSAFAIKESKKLGIDSLPLTVKANNTLSRVRAIVDEVRSHETPEALSDLGLETLTGLARFEGVNILRVNEKLIHAKQIVIATGSSASIPKIHGLDKTPYLTNETVFGLKEIPKSLTVIGGGPIGCELAQAFLRLGSKTTLVHSHAELLNREDSSARSIIANQFLSEGMILHLKTGVKEVFYDQGRFTILLENGQYFESEALLISVGRKPNVSALNLEAAGVNYHEKGISVDAYGRTNQHHIWAVGDVVGPPFFTHWAESQARSVLTSLLLPFEFKKKIDKTQPIPRVTFTDPEVASAGLTEDEAKENYTTATYTVPFSQVDRAVTTGRTEGFVKIVTKKWSSKILGCTIVGERAGEMLGEVTLAMHAEIPLRKLAGLIHPYPTYNQAIRKAADLWLTQTVLSLFKREDMIKNIKKYLPVLIILIAMVAIYFSGIYNYFSFDTLRTYHQNLKSFVEMHPVAVSFIFCLTYIITTALSIPGAIFLTLLGGYLFPQPLSTIYVVLSATCGATLIFLAARSALKDFLKRKAGPLLQKMEAGFKENAASYLLFLRFVPLFPFWLVNIAPAFFDVSLLTFIWTTLIGILPGSLVFTLAGGGLQNILENNEPFSLNTILNTQIKIALVLLGIIALIPIAWKKFKKKST